MHQAQKENNADVFSMGVGDEKSAVIFAPVLDTKEAPFFPPQQSRFS